MPLAIGFELFLLFDQTAPGVLHLHGEKLVRSFRQYLAVTKVLFNEQGREAIRHPHNGRRIVANVRNAERISLENLNLDVVPHPLDDILFDSSAPLLRVEVEILDNPLQTRAAEDL